MPRRHHHTVLIVILFWVQSRVLVTVSPHVQTSQARTFLWVVIRNSYTRFRESVSEWVNKWVDIAVCMFWFKGKNWLKISLTNIPYSSAVIMITLSYRNVTANNDTNIFYYMASLCRNEWNGWYVLDDSGDEGYFMLWYHEKHSFR